MTILDFVHAQHIDCLSDCTHVSSTSSSLIQQATTTKSIIHEQAIDSIQPLPHKPNICN